MKVKITFYDNRWDGKMDEFWELYNAKIGDMKQYYGAMNNSILFYTRDAVDSTRFINDYRINKKREFINNQFGFIDFQLLNHPHGFFNPKNYGKDIRNAFVKNVTPRMLYDHWVQGGAKPYMMLVKAVNVLRHKLELIYAEHECKIPKPVAYLATCVRLLEDHHVTQDFITKELGQLLGIGRKSMKFILEPFCLDNMREAVVSLMDAIYPEGVNMQFTDRENHIIKLAWDSVMQLYHNPDFIFDGATESIRDDDEVFKSNGLRKKYEILSHEAKESFIKQYS